MRLFLYLSDSNFNLSLYVQKLDLIYLYNKCLNPSNISRVCPRVRSLLRQVVIEFLNISIYMHVMGKLLVSARPCVLLSFVRNLEPS